MADCKCDSCQVGVWVFIAFFLLFLTCNRVDTLENNDKAQQEKIEQLERSLKK